MDILEFLRKDHERFCMELDAIEQALDDKSVMKDIRRFMVGYELHESIEEEILFPKFYSMPGQIARDQSVFQYEELHTTVWELLERLFNTLRRGRIEEIREAFGKFSVFAKSHFAHEENILFPAIRGAVEPDMLERLGRKAEVYASRFRPQNRELAS